MARYDHLPLYKLSYDVLLEVLELTKNFPKDYRYTLGQSLQTSALDLLKKIYRANSAEDKGEIIKDMLDNIQEIGVLIRISKDIRILPEKRFFDLICKHDNLEKQACGWLKSLK